MTTTQAIATGWRPLRIAAWGTLALIVAATGGLWAHYGTTVFFEVIRAGWVACF